MVKKTCKSSSPEPRKFRAESWYIASRAQALPSLFDDHRLTFDLFMARSNLRRHRFLGGGGGGGGKLKNHFFFSICI